MEHQTHAAANAFTTRARCLPRQEPGNQLSLGQQRRLARSQIPRFATSAADQPQPVAMLKIRKASGQIRTLASTALPTYGLYSCCSCCCFVYVVVVMISSIIIRMIKINISMIRMMIIIIIIIVIIVLLLLLLLWSSLLLLSLVLLIFLLILFYYLRACITTRRSHLHASCSAHLQVLRRPPQPVQHRWRHPPQQRRDPVQLQVQHRSLQPVQLHLVEHGRASC